MYRILATISGIGIAGLAFVNLVFDPRWGDEMWVDIVYLVLAALLILGTYGSRRAESPT